MAVSRFSEQGNVWYRFIEKNKINMNKYTNNTVKNKRNIENTYSNDNLVLIKYVDNKKSNAVTPTNWEIVTNQNEIRLVNDFIGKNKSLDYTFACYKTSVINDNNKSSIAESNKVLTDEEIKEIKGRINMKKAITGEEMIKLFNMNALVYIVKEKGDKLRFINGPSNSPEFNVATGLTIDQNNIIQEKIIEAKEANGIIRAAERAGNKLSQENINKLIASHHLIRDVGISNTPRLRLTYSPFTVFTGPQQGGTRRKRRHVKKSRKAH